MPPGPKSRISRAKRGKRRSHHFLDKPPVTRCPKTNELHEPHKAYKSVDGSYYYKGKAISLPRKKLEESKDPS